jgi:hypothetical protein
MHCLRSHSEAKCPDKKLARHSGGDIGHSVFLYRHFLGDIEHSDISLTFLPPNTKLGIMKLTTTIALTLLTSLPAIAREPYVDFLPNRPPTLARPLESEQEIFTQSHEEEAHFFKHVSGSEYISILRSAAKGNRKSLSLLFKSAQHQDGAGAEGLASSLFWLLHKVGDETFSSALSAQPLANRKRVIGLLDFAADYDYSAKFPKTFRIAKHEPE